jgi:hypothetical protein
LQLKNLQENMRDKDFQFIKTFDEIKGPDIFSIDFGNISYFGFVDSSPVEPRLIENFGYLNLHDNYTKPYRAHWTIYNSKLMLLYCNGIINNRRLYTNDMFPEFRNLESLAFFSMYTGKLLFYPVDFTITKFDSVSVPYNGRDMYIQIDSGIVTKVEYV